MSNTTLQLFEYSGHQVRTIMIEDDPWFVLNDVCQVLDISNVGNVATRVDEPDIQNADVRSSGQIRSMKVVNESGLYDVVFMSRKPEARDFKRWVTRDVLPSIRKTGGYGEVTPTGEKLLALAVVEAQQMLEAKDEKIAELQPKADYANMISNSEGLRTINDLANDLKVHAAANHPGVKVYNQDVFDLAGELGLIIRGNTVRHNQPTAKAIEANWVSPAETTYTRKSGEVVTKRYTRLTPRGYARIWETAAHRLNNNLPLVTPKQKEIA